MDEFDINKLSLRMQNTGGSNYLSRMPLYECLRRTLQEMITDGEIPDGCRLPADKNFATSLGINHRTLGKALNELRQCGLLIRHRAKGTFVNSPKNGEIGSFGNKEKLVSVIFDDTTQGTFHTDLFVAIHNKLVANNLEVLFMSSAGRPDTQFATIRSILLKPNCCGCIVWSIMSETQVRELMQIKPKNFPLIILDKAYSGIAYDSVRYDAFDAAQKIGTYYVNRGYQKLAFVVAKNKEENVKSRIAGVRSALPNPQELEVISFDKGDTVDLDKYEGIPVVTANLEALNWLYQIRQNAKSQSGNSIQVATFATRNDLLPPLPVMEVIFSSEEVGYKSVELLVARLHGDQSDYQKHLIKGTIHESIISTALVHNN